MRPLFLAFLYHLHIIYYATTQSPWAPLLPDVSLICGLDFLLERRMRLLLRGLLRLKLPPASSKSKWPEDPVGVLIVPRNKLSPPSRGLLQADEGGVAGCGCAPFPPLPFVPAYALDLRRSPPPAPKNPPGAASATLAVGHS